MRRVRTESTVRQDLVRFYGLQGRLRCVVTQSVQDVQAHHIWDNPSSSLFEELIPVTGDINRKFAEYALRELGKIDWVAPDPLLRPVVLLATADSHFMAGRIALGYGCSRLSTVILTRYPNCISPSTLHVDTKALLVDSWAHSLSHASHSGRHDLVFDVLHRDVRPWLAHHRLAEIDRGALGIELATLLQDYSSPAIAAQALDFIEKKLKRLRDPRREKTLLRLSRRRVISSLMMGQVDASAAEMLRNAAVLAQSRGDLLEQVKIDVLRAAAALVTGSPAGAIDVFEPWRERLFSRDGFRREFLADPWVSLLGSISQGVGFFEIEKTRVGLDKKLEGARFLLETAESQNIKLRYIARRLIGHVDGRASGYLRHLPNEGMPDIFALQPDSLVCVRVFDEIRECFSLLYAG
ncbi:hypothetical protein [Roseateles puraquae]|uniref:hypothetical protein n=1 Tax=Roseateles puraquae TaxID=431059 RepID=UPI0031DE2752